ncbi:MAG: hypothetical protein M3434_11970, partial [Gemmatimonadota bacterium]|nr:hypothetical protein [Gemmatimonadota bacterium]
MPWLPEVASFWDDYLRVQDYPEEHLTLAPTRAPRLWMPDRVTFTADALREPWGEQIRARVEALALPRAKGGGGYPIGLVVAPIVAVPEWQTQYTRLL